MDPREFKKEALRLLDALPEAFRSRLHNVEIVIEKRPTRNQLKAAGIDPRQETLYGLYEGIPLSERSVTSPPLLPDRITIFYEPLMRDFPNSAELRDQIRVTLLHEIAHYFGIDEDEIEKLGY